MKYLAKNLLFLRTKLKLTQGQVADFVGLKNNNVSSWENGNSLPALKKLFILSKKLEFNIDDILNIDMEINEIASDEISHRSTSTNLLMEDLADYGKERVFIPGIDFEARTLRVTGDSMSPVLMHGDYVVGEEVSDVRSVRQNSLCIVCMAGRIEVKYVTRYEAGLRLVSESDKNKSELVEWGNIDSVWEVRVRITESIGVVGHPDYLRLVGEVEEVRKSIDNLKNNKDEN